LKDKIPGTGYFNAIGSFLFYNKNLIMKRLLLPIILLFTVNTLIAQVKQLKKVSSLQMARTVDDDMPGTRGAAVAWHPIQKKYFASMAGNQQYPLGIFDETGKRISKDDQNCLQDVRGLWFNPSKKAIMGNSFGEGGWFIYKLDEEGIVYKAETVFEGMNQPTGQSVGTYHSGLNQVIFLDIDSVYFYNSTTAVKEKSIFIHLGQKKKTTTAQSDAAPEEVMPDYYNNSTVVYTGVKGSELGLLNIDKKQIELYNIANGYMTTILGLPEESTVESSFNFAYCNNIYWLFNIEKRTWMGYK